VLCNEKFVCFSITVLKLDRFQDSIRFILSNGNRADSERQLNDTRLWRIYYQLTRIMSSQFSEWRTICMRTGKKRIRRAGSIAEGERECRRLLPTYGRHSWLDSAVSTTVRVGWSDYGILLPDCDGTNRYKRLTLRLCSHAWARVRDYEYFAYTSHWTSSALRWWRVYLLHLYSPWNKLANDKQSWAYYKYTTTSM